MAMRPFRIVIGMLALLTASAGFAAAQSSASGAIDADDASLGASALVDDASAASAHAVADGVGAAVDGSVDASDVETAADGGFWAALELRFAAFFDALADMVGLEASDAGGASATVGSEGASLGLDVGADDLQVSGVGHVGLQEPSVALVGDASAHVEHVGSVAGSVTGSLG